MAKAPRHPGRDGLKASLSRVLDDDKKRRHDRQRKQAKVQRIEKAETRRRDREASEAVLADEKIQVEALVRPEQRQHGLYQVVPFEFVEVTEGGRVTKKERKVVRNMGGTPVERWNARGRLTERQMAAILFYQHAWSVHIGQPRVTANYSPAVAHGFKGSVELWASSAIHAKESLRLLDQEVFFRIPVEHFEVWQNVVLWDEPAGVAGSRVGFCHKPAEAASLLIVQLVGGMIADVVITETPRDWGNLLLDLDAPRKPRGRRIS